MHRDTHLRFVSISHRTAPVACRERFYVADADKQEFSALLREEYPDIKSFLLLVTCNRTEIYFESQQTTAERVLNTFLEYKLGKNIPEERCLFTTGDKTEGTVKHLLRVAAGLESTVLGDAEILNQVKKAYHFALERGLQGSLLERAVQTVFRSHKRVSNETAFRDGTTSTAYKALKMVSSLYRSQAHEKKILVVGAGDIVQQLLRYNTKFGYTKVWLANRTESKALQLAQLHKVHVCPWKSIINNDLKEFDVIISAVSNRSGLISKGLDTSRQLLLIDLAVPGNIDPKLVSRSNVVFSDLDNITSHLEVNRSSRIEATTKVEGIIREEWELFIEWYRMQPFREILAKRKLETLKTLKDHEAFRAYQPGELSRIADQIIRKLLKNPDSIYDANAVKEMTEQMAVLHTV
ncbi:MAG: glutamyl-tRNA reductase [Eudoraea sp.]|nr:glutamyl-tRNA reductase [Eudoraea sp.]